MFGYRPSLNDVIAVSLRRRCGAFDRKLASNRRQNDLRGYFCGYAQLCQRRNGFLHKRLAGSMDSAPGHHPSPKVLNDRSLRLVAKAVREVSLDRPWAGRAVRDDVFLARLTVMDHIGRKCREAVRANSLRVGGIRAGIKAVGRRQEGETAPPLGMTPTDHVILGMSFMAEWAPPAFRPRSPCSHGTASSMRPSRFMR
jgi:hypothetical protein